MNRLFTVFLASLGLGITAQAQTFKEWTDAETNAVNRALMRAAHFAYSNIYLWVNGKYVGYSEDSWGARPLPRYMIPYGDRTFKFNLRPIFHQLTAF